MGDSRLWGVDNYAKPKDVNIEFVLRRGAKIEELVDPTVDLLKEQRFKAADIVVVKVAAGINNLTFIDSHKSGREISRSSTTDLALFNKIKDFKQKIKEVCPNALVGFATIPTLSFKKNIEYRIRKGNLVKSKHTKHEIDHIQNELDETVGKVNTRIKLENSNRQVGHRKGCLTVSLHRDVAKQTKRRNRSGRLRVIEKNSFKQLYDGLHAESSLKHKWFDKLCQAVKTEIGFTLKDKAASVRVTIEGK